MSDDRPPGERAPHVGGPGDLRSPGPLGLDGLPAWEMNHPLAPATRLLSESPTSAAPRVRTDHASVRPASSKSVQKFIKQVIRPRGAPATPVPQPARPEREAPAPEKPSTSATIRSALSPQGMSAIRAMMFDPKLALTVAQRDVLNRLGRSAQAGDKAGVRGSLMELADRLDVTSPRDGAVMVLDSPAAGSQALVNQGLLRLETGKRSLEMTQGGRTMGALAPVLQKSGGFAWTDGLDRGWQRLNQRFGQQAHGVVDLVMPGDASPAKPAAAAGAVGQPPAIAAPQDAPVGRWGASTGAAPASPGAWSTPEGSNAESGGVGAWKTGDPTDGVGQWSASPDGTKAAPVGQWSAPSETPDAQAGAWSSPKVGKDGAAAEVGRWSAVPDGSDRTSQVGQWTAPAADGPQVNAGSWTRPDSSQPSGQPPVGGWNRAPGGPHATPSSAIGQWHSGDAEAGGGSPSPGRWAAPSAAGSVPAPPAAGGPPPAAAAPTQPPTVDLKTASVAGGLRVADLLTANPNISGVRLVEAVGGPSGQPTTLRELTSLGRALLQKRLGLF